VPSRRVSLAGYLALAVLGCVVFFRVYSMANPADEVVLTLGEPYEQVRQQSHSTLPETRPDGTWGGFVTRPAKFRFAASGYGFVTPPAKFLYVGAGKFGKVESVTLSPQVETLPLEKAMAVVLNLQEQLQQHGWRPIRVHRFPPIANTPAMVASIRRRSSDFLAGSGQIPGRARHSTVRPRKQAGRRALSDYAGTERCATDGRLPRRLMLFLFARGGLRGSYTKPDNAEGLQANDL
jgi:hypothetical protein